MVAQERFELLFYRRRFHSVFLTCLSSCQWLILSVNSGFIIFFGTESESILIWMAKKGKMTTIWVSWDTYRRLLEVKGFLTNKDGCARNPDDVIHELIEFWQESQRELQRTYEVKKSYLLRSA